MFRRRFMARRQVGLKFTDQSSSKLNAQQAGIKYVNSSTGGFAVSGILGNQTGNIYTYSIQRGVKITSPSPGNMYFLVAEISEDSIYIIGLIDNQIVFEPFVMSNSYDNHYKWNLISKSTGYDFTNVLSNNYATVDENGILSVQATSPTGYFSYETGHLQYANSSKTWIPYYVNSNTINITDSTQSYNAFLYSYSKSGFTVTLTRVSDSTQIVGKQLILAIRASNGRYYLVGLDTNSYLTLFDTGASSTTNGNISFRSFNSNSFFSQYYFNVSSYDTGFLLQFNYNKNYYLTPPTGILSNSSAFTRTTTKGAVGYNSSVGVHLYVASLGDFGVTSLTQQMSTTTITSNAGTTIVFRKDGSVWSPYYGTLNTGDIYAIAVRKMPTDENHPGNNTASYYLVGYDGTNLVAHEFATLEDIVVTSDCEFTATSGTNGCGLVIGNKGLNVNNNNLAMLDVSADWYYIGDASVPDNSRLWTVTTQTTDYYTEYANSDLEANTQATDTTCDIFLVQNGKVQIQADEFVDGETYVLVFVDNGNHYAACVNGTDIVPVLYANSLPKNLPSDYHFVAEASGQGFLLKHNNQYMGVAVNAKLTIGYNAVWTYTYAVPEESE